MPGPIAALQSQLSIFATHAPGSIALAVEDLTTGMTTGVNANEEMPAASTIKIPVMVELFRQMERGTFDLNTRLTLRGGDKDDGSGDLCYARSGNTYPVSQLLSLMIDDSDNTATNMLIRLVGRQEINHTMRRFGLTHTRLTDFVRSEGPIRFALRSSPSDMTHLLTAMAKHRLIDEWSSRQMIAVLTAQHINTLLPVPLPAGTTIAHKTGSLHDTLNDVGIVYPAEADDSYVIAVMTTDLSNLESGRRFIRGVSSMAYNAMGRFASWRESTGFATPAFANDPAFAPLSAPTDAPSAADPMTPDQQMWTPTEAEPAAADPAATAAPAPSI